MSVFIFRRTNFSSSEESWTKEYSACFLKSCRNKLNEYHFHMNYYESRCEHNIQFP